jgi:hypothetical protein
MTEFRNPPPRAKYLWVVIDTSRKPTPIFRGPLAECLRRADETCKVVPA